MPVSYTPFIALSEVTGKYFREKYLFGFTFLGDDGQPLPDSWFEDFIATAIGKVEEIINVDILQRNNVGEKHDYHAQDWNAFGFIPLFRFPATSVQEVRAIVTPGQTVQVFPSTYVRLEVSHSQIHLVPTAGSLATISLGQGVEWLPFFSGRTYYPHLWEVDYVSGFDPEKIPRMVVDAFCKYAAIDILTILSDTITPLGQTSSSLSVDGLSQSRSYNIPAFKARIDAYKEELGLPLSEREAGILAEIRKQYVGIILVSM